MILICFWIKLRLLLILAPSQPIWDCYIYYFGFIYKPHKQLHKNQNISRNHHLKNRVKLILNTEANRNLIKKKLPTTLIHPNHEFAIFHPDEPNCNEPANCHFGSWSIYRCRKTQPFPQLEHLPELDRHLYHSS